MYGYEISLTNTQVGIGRICSSGVVVCLHSILMYLMNFHFAVVSFSHNPKVLFSVSEHTARYPMPSTANFGILTFPPSLSTLEEYSSTDGTSIKFTIPSSSGAILLLVPPLTPVLPSWSFVVILQDSTPSGNSSVGTFSDTLQINNYRTFLIFLHYLSGFQNVRLLACHKMKTST